MEGIDDELEQFLKSLEELKRLKHENDEQSNIPKLTRGLQLTGENVDIRSDLARRDSVWLDIKDGLHNIYILNSDKQIFTRYANVMVILARNLVSVPGADRLCRENKVNEIALDLTIRSLEENEKNLYDSKLITSTIQLYANLCTATKDQYTSELYLRSILALPAKEFIDEITANSSLIPPLLILIKIALSNGTSDKILYEDAIGHHAFLYILDNCSSWYSDEKTSLELDISQDICRNILQRGDGPYFLSTFHWHDEDDASARRFLALLRIFHSVVESVWHQGSQERSTEQIEFTKALQKEFKLLSSSSLPFLKGSQALQGYDDDSKAKARFFWNSLYLSLEMLQDLLTEHNVKSCLLSDDDLVTDLVELLNNAQIYLPRQSKLSQVDLDADPSDPELQLHFPFIKSKLIYILSILTTGNRHVQDLIRTLFGLEIILSNCIVDQNNPFIREYSILCLRYLLESNEINQSFVARLEAKNNVSEDALLEAGFETTLINGKMALKPVKANDS